LLNEGGVLPSSVFYYLLGELWGKGGDLKKVAHKMNLHLNEEEGYDEKIILFGIHGDDFFVLTPLASTVDMERHSLMVDLVAGKSTDVGDIKVWNDDSTLFVKFVGEGSDCDFLEAHISIAEDALPEGILTTNGNPSLSVFREVFDSGCFSSHTFQYNLETEGLVPGDTVQIASHATLGWKVEIGVTEAESAWGCDLNENCIPLGEKNRAKYFEFIVNQVWADFSGLLEGESVEGLAKVAPFLDITTFTGGAVKIVEGGSWNAYGSPNSGCNGETTVIGNWGTRKGEGFTDKISVEGGYPHSYTFNFEGVTISHFSLRMLDYGDWNPSKAGFHKAEMVAFNGVGESVSTHVLSYYTSADGTPNWSWSTNYGNLQCNTGDSAAPGAFPGHWIWKVSGEGITKVTLTFPFGYDPYIGFDSLWFVVKP
jgi:hypothetical protein